MLNGRAGIPRTARQAQHVVFTLANVVQRFKRGGGRPENNGDLLAVGAVHG